MQNRSNSLFHSMEEPSQQSGLILQSQQALYGEGVRLLKGLRAGEFKHQDGRNRAFRLYAEMLLVVRGTTEASSPVNAVGLHAVRDASSHYYRLTVAIRSFFTDYEWLKANQRCHDKSTSNNRHTLEGRMGLVITPNDIKSLRKLIPADNEAAVIEKVAGYLGISARSSNLEEFIAQINQHQCPEGGQQAVAGGAAKTSSLSVSQVNFQELFGIMLKQEFSALQSSASGRTVEVIDSPADSSLRLEPDDRGPEDQAATQIQAAHRGATVRRAQAARRIQAATQIQAVYRGVMDRRRVQAAMDRSEGNVVDSDQAATQIQAVYRGATVRRAQQEETQIQAATQIQSAYRGVMARRQAQAAMDRSEGNVVEHDSVSDSSLLELGTVSSSQTAVGSPSGSNHSSEVNSTAAEDRSEGNVVEHDSVSDSSLLELGPVSSSQTAVGSPSGSNHSSEVNSTAADTLSGPNADATKVNRHQGRDNTLMWLIALAMTVGGVMIQQALSPSVMMPTVGGVLPHMPIYMALYGGAVMLVALILMNKLHDQFDHGSGLRFLSRVSLVSVMIGASVLNGVVSLPLPEVVMTMIPFVTGGLAALIGIGVVVGSCKVVCQSMGQSSVSNGREDGFAPKDLSVGSHSLSGPEAAANSSQGDSFRQGGFSPPALSPTSSSF